jgi:hypothetical protein
VFTAIVVAYFCLSTRKLHSSAYRKLDDIVNQGFPIAAELMEQKQNYSGFHFIRYLEDGKREWIGLPDNEVEVDWDCEWPDAEDMDD